MCAAVRVAVRSSALHAFIQPVQRVSVTGFTCEKGKCEVKNDIWSASFRPSEKL